MKLRHLEVFFVVAEELHFGRAASRLHVAQPAVSQTVKALEEELGVQLFDRSRRSTRLTAAGSVFLEESQAAMERLRRAGQMARQVAEGERGRLLLGMTTVSTLSPLPEAILSFQQRYPNVAVKVEQMGTTEQCRALSLGELDVGFTVMMGEFRGLVSEALTEEPLMAMLPASHRLAATRSVALHSLLEEPIILMTQQREPSIHRAYHRLCEEAGCPPRVVLELDHLESMLAFVAAGMGVSLAPAAALRLRLDGVVGRPVTPAFPGGISFVWNPQQLHPVTARFLDLVRALRDQKEGSLEPQEA